MTSKLSSRAPTTNVSYSFVWIKCGTQNSNLPRLTDVSPAGAIVISTGTVAYIPLSNTVKSYTGDQNTTIQYEFGKIKNVGENPTEVVLELAYKINHAAASATGVNATAKLNGNPIQLETFDIIQNVSRTRAGATSKIWASQGPK